MGKLIVRDGVQYEAPFGQDDDVYIASVKLSQVLEEIRVSLMVMDDDIKKIKVKIGA